jgi:hypothetical protein
MPLRPLYSKRGSYYTIPRTPGKKTEKRIVMPQIKKRPVRFQARSLIRQEYIHKDPWWMIIHRRGISRPYVGENPLEARAVPHSLVRGTLPERIVYKSLIDYFHLIPDFDFSFQTSLQGGRIDTGGIVADFIFPYLQMVLQVQGPTHKEVLRMWKDSEQQMALEEMGYTVYFIEEDEIYNEIRLENRLRRLLHWMHGGGTSTEHDFDEVQSNEGFATDKILTQLMEVSDYINTGTY